MESILRLLADKKIDATTALIGLVDAIRPRWARNSAVAVAKLRALAGLLEAQPDLRVALRKALQNLFSTHRQVTLYTEVGILPNTSFLGEMKRRFSHTLLPDVLDPNDCKSVVMQVFHRSSDSEWVGAIPESSWHELFAAMHWEERETSGEIPYVVRQLIESLRILTYWIAAISFEPELLRIDPAIERFESPFVALNREMDRYLSGFTQWWNDRSHDAEDEKHLLVLIDQCQQVLIRMRRRALQDGTSLKLTYSLQRLSQLLERTERLLLILGAMQRQSFLMPADSFDGDDRADLSRHYPNVVALFKSLVIAVCRQNDLRYFWRQNIEILSMRVTENAGRTGEHYITENRAQYWTLARSALGAGIIIACMTVNKLLLGTLGMTQLNEGITFALNYGLGFVLIHVLHCTVATKQPAMTANAIAASIGESSGKTRELKNLTTLIARTTRSQIVAILGNVGMAVPCAIVLSLLWRYFFGELLISQEKAAHLLADHHPLYSGSLAYAAIAGFCLFLSGLIAGYYDNRASYGKIPERLMQLKWPRQLLGEWRVRRLANYVGNNLGALAGNFFFGVLLGGMWTFGQLFNLPIDIRHVAFSSAYLGCSLVAFDFSPDAAFGWAALGVALIGLTNLAVSFSLALVVALRARQVTFAQRRVLVSSIWKRLRQNPGEFFLPPDKAIEQIENAKPNGS